MDEQDCSWTEFDLGALTYPQFLAFFFDRPVVPFDESFNLFRGGINVVVCSDPAVVVSPSPDHVPELRWIAEDLFGGADRSRSMGGLQQNRL